MTLPASRASSATSSNGAGRWARSRRWRRCSTADPLIATVGVGHTRWATHGKPSEANAHPQRAGRVAVVHNGIIENYAELREAPEGEGSGVRERNRHRGDRPSDRRGLERGRCAARRPEGGARPDPRRLRPGHPDRGRGRARPGRAPRQPAGGRLRRRGDVPGVGRPGRRALHQPRDLSGRRRLRRHRPRQRLHLRPDGQAGGAARRGGARLGRPGREGQLPPLHGKGDPRPARRRVSGPSRPMSTRSA